MDKLFDGLVTVAAAVLLGVAYRTAADRRDPVAAEARTELTDAGIAAFIEAASREGTPRRTG